ncbi:hypothetical protein K1719_022246 [Acacia pycnantha]|nr:hypothetical protein K1719_022246 [Acacia pycnantha]
MDRYPEDELIVEVVRFKYYLCKRQFPNILSMNNVATSSAINRNSHPPIRIYSGNTSPENNIGTPQATILRSLSRFDMHSALTDITNTHSNGDLIQSNISGLTFECNINFTPSDIFNVTQDTGANLPQSLQLSNLDEGDAVYTCKFCGAPMWLSESLKRVRKSELPQFNMCCGNGKILLPLLKPPPSELADLFFNKESAYSKKFMKNNHHLIGSLLPHEGNPPVYSQLYIYDTDNEVSNRISAVSRHGYAEELNPNIVKLIKDCLDENNSILPTTSELAALIVGDFDNSYTKRYIIVRKQSGDLQRIDELHMTYLPLQYPLLFPYGNNGYDLLIEHAAETLSRTKKKKKKLTPREYLAFRLMRRRSERSVILHGKKLLHQFIVDGYSMVESDRLDYIRMHQKELRVDLYSGISYAVTRGETDPSSTRRRVILPSSFTGGARYMIQNYQDAMAICACAGYPDIFITFTCNPMWLEITHHCDECGLKPCDKPEVLSMIFNVKLNKLMRILKDEKIFGTVKAVEKVMTPFDVDKLISAEIPDRDVDPDLYELVGSYMVHGPCATVVDENGYPTYRRRNDKRMVTRKGVELDNRYVVPYNARLLKLFDGHLNVEKTNQSRAIKYLFKYISKGHDRVIAGIYNANDNPSTQQTVDEISHYLNCRYVSACEASWIIFSFDIHQRQPPVERLSFHLPHQQSIYYSLTENMSSVVNNPRVKESMFLAWMEKNKDDPFAITLTYSQFPNYFTFVRDKRIWKLRERGFSVGRLGHCTPSQGELYYIRLLLTKVRGAKDYASIRTVNNVVYPTFREACYALGLLDDDKEYIDAIKEASVWATSNYLWQFFTSMLLSHSLFDPSIVWEQTKEVICEDLLHVNHRDERFQDLQITNANKEAPMLANIQQLLLQNGRSLNDYPSMPKPENDLIIDTSEQLILQELNYNKMKEMETSSRLERLMTEEQKKVYEEIICAVSSKIGASSGIAATLLPSGRTAHSRFCIPIDVNEDFVSGKSSVAGLRGPPSSTLGARGAVALPSLRPFPEVNLAACWCEETGIFLVLFLSQCWGVLIILIVIGLPGTSSATYLAVSPLLLSGILERVLGF